MEHIDIKEQITTELRPFFVVISAWHTVELELEAYKKDGNKRHLTVAVVMASVALEAFFNNIVEFYCKEKFPKFDSVQWTLKRFRRGVKFLNPSLVVNDLDGWKMIRELFDLRNEIVHNKVTSTLIHDGTLMQANEYELDWERAEEKILAVKTFVFSLRDHLTWKDSLLEGQFTIPMEQRFHAFFTPFESTKDIEEEAGIK